MTWFHSQTERNKDTAQKFFDEVFNKGNMAFVDETISPSYTFDGQPQTTAQLKEWAAGMRTAFPDLHFTIQALLGDGDAVALRWQMTGTHTGGPNPSGKSVVATGTNILTFDADGKGVTNMQNGMATLTLNGQSQTFTDALIYQN